MKNQNLPPKPKIEADLTGGSLKLRNRHFDCSRLNTRRWEESGLALNRIQLMLCAIKTDLALQQAARMREILNQISAGGCNCTQGGSNHKHELQHSLKTVERQRRNLVTPTPYEMPFQGSEVKMDPTVSIQSLGESIIELEKPRRPKTKNNNWSSLLRVF